MSRLLICFFLGVSFLGCIYGELHVTVGYLPSMYSYREKGLLGVSLAGVVPYAIQKINDDPTILPNIKLNLIWQDMKGKSTVSDLISENALAFFGPERSCADPAILAGSFHLPMISHRCSEYNLSDHSQFPTFARTIPSDMSLAKALMSLLKSYSWNKFSMIVEDIERSRMLAEAVKLQSIQNTITITQTLIYPVPFSVNSKHFFNKIIDSSYKQSQIYVFIGDQNAMIGFMQDLNSLGLLDSGDYMVIYIVMDAYYKDEPTKYLEYTVTPLDELRSSPLVEALKSLLIITIGPSPIVTEENRDFEEKANQYLSGPMMNFNAAKLGDVKISIYGYYLYDAVNLYAQALHQHITESGLTEEKAVRDGEGIIKRIKDIHYKSITGHTVYIDDNGLVQSKFLLLARKPHETQYADISMIPVGEFSSDEEPKLLMFDKIDWKKGRPPTLCEYDCDSAIENIVQKNRLNLINRQLTPSLEN